MKRRPLVTLVLALAVGMVLTAADRLQAEDGAVPTKVRLVATQSDAPAWVHGSEAYYQERVPDTRLAMAPMPDDVMPYQDSGMAFDAPVSDEVPPAPGAMEDPGYASTMDPAPSETYPTQEPPGPWHLFDSPCLKYYGINFGGWLQQGITFNGDDPSDRFNGPVATNDRDGEYQMNQFWLFMDRPVGQRGHCWELGGRIDMIYGTDYRYGISYGLDDRINGMDSYYGLVIPQAYLALGNDRFSVLVGHFAGILNYEQVPAPANFFYSHSYQMGYGEPLLVTGLMSSYKLTQNWSVAAGFHRGWMMWEDNNESLDFMGGLSWTGDNKTDRLAFNVDVGPQDPIQQGDTVGQRDRFVYSLIYQHEFSDRTSYALEHTYGYEQDGAFWANQDAEWYGIAQYLYYAINEAWKAGLRIEIFRDNNGARVAGVGHLVPGHGWDGGPGFAGNFCELTLGLNWRPNPNVVMRPEIRWDVYDGSPDLNGQLPFDDGNSDRQFLFATDLIVTF